MRMALVADWATEPVVSKWLNLSFLLGRTRKWEPCTFVRTVAHKNKRFVFVVLFHECRVLKTLQHGRFSLNSCVGNVTDLVAVESSPMLTKVSSMEGKDIPVVDKVDKGVTAIAPVLEVDWKVEKVNHSRTVAIFGEFVQ